MARVVRTWKEVFMAGLNLQQRLHEKADEEREIITRDSQHPCREWNPQLPDNETGLTTRQLRVCLETVTKQAMYT